MIGVFCRQRDAYVQIIRINTLEALGQRCDGILFIENEYFGAIRGKGFLPK